MLHDTGLPVVTRWAARSSTFEVHRGSRHGDCTGVDGEIVRLREEEFYNSDAET